MENVIMSPEDKTFNRLRRITFNDMRYLMRILNDPDDQYRSEQLLEENGWDENDYYLELLIILNKELNNG